MLPEIGLVSLALALMLSLALSVVPLLGAHRGHAAWMATARPLAYTLLAAVAVSYGLLTWAFLVHDFSVAYVAQNSNSLLPRAYQYTKVRCCCGCCSWCSGRPWSRVSRAACRRRWWHACWR